MTYLAFAFSFFFLIFLGYSVCQAVFKLTNFQNIFQHIYWKKSTYKSTYSTQTHVVQGSAILINSDIDFIYMYYNCSYGWVYHLAVFTYYFSLFPTPFPLFSVFFWLYIFCFHFLKMISLDIKHAFLSYHLPWINIILLQV